MGAVSDVQSPSLPNRVDHYRSRLMKLRAGLSALRCEIDALMGDLESDIESLPGSFALASTVTAAGSSAEPLTIPLEDLTTIKGIDPATAFMLAGMGLSRFSDIAALDEEDVAEIGARMGDDRRIARENWIEQAAILARGESTEFSRQRAMGSASAAAAEASQVNGATASGPKTPSAAIAIPDAAAEPGTKDGSKPTEAAADPTDAPTEAVATTAEAAPDLTSTKPDTAGEPTGDAQICAEATETAAGAAQADTAEKIVELDAARDKRSRRPLQRIATAASAAACVVAVIALGHDLDPAIGASLSRLTGCGGSIIDAGSNCEVLAWMLL